MDPEPMIVRFVYVCEARTCSKLRVIDVAINDWDGEATCPVCSEAMTEVDDLSKYSTCISVDCTQYLSTVAGHDTKNRCEGKRGAKKGECKLPLVTLDDDTVADLPDETSEGEVATKGSPAARRLQAAVNRAIRWVKTSGSHHRSTGGSHTASARERHSKASGSKARVRESMAEHLNDLITEVKADKDPDLTLISNAENAKKAVQNK